MFIQELSSQIELKQDNTKQKQKHLLAYGDPEQVEVPLLHMFTSHSFSTGEIVTEELILFGFGELDSRMLWMELEHNEEEMG